MAYQRSPFEVLDENPDISNYLRARLDKENYQGMNDLDDRVSSVIGETVQLFQYFRDREEVDLLDFRTADFDTMTFQEAGVVEIEDMEVKVDPRYLAALMEVERQVYPDERDSSSSSPQEIFESVADGEDVVEVDEQNEPGAVFMRQIENTLDATDFETGGDVGWF